jgi:CheY-like chemotaxis protein
MRRASVGMLENLGYRTVEADNAAAALETIDRDGPFSLVFSDIVMPGAMNGIDLAHEVRRRGMKVLLASGFASPVAIRGEATAQGLNVLTKPFRKADLAAHVRALLDAGDGPGTTDLRPPI